MNAAAKKAHGNNKVPIKLTTKEKHDQKINPTRGQVRQHGRSPRRHSTRSTRKSFGSCHTPALSESSLMPIYTLS